VKATIAVPAGGGCFEGHFPGRPILPGVVLLDLALQALASAQQRPAPLRGIAFARLRQLVTPGDQLELAARHLDDAQVRIDLRRGTELVANAQLNLGVPGSPPAAGIELEPVDPELCVAALDALLPHRLPMRLVDSIARELADGLVCTASVPQACALAQHGYAPALAGVEAAAQTAAVWEALRRWRQSGGGAPRIGYLVALRDMVFFAEQVAVGSPMLAAIQLEASAPPLTHYRVETCVGGKVLVRGTIATYLT
jgi:3-hydroxymyristoyl/3-hydroxydecanoyl-(acyl carrier protein) dehydratase